MKKEWKNPQLISLSINDGTQFGEGTTGDASMSSSTWSPTSPTSPTSPIS